MSAGAITLADITNAYWSVALDATMGGTPGAGLGSVVQGRADIDQCIGIILQTPLGADPLRPTFGIDQTLYIDVPIAMLPSKLVGAAKTAIETWEPRILVDQISIVQSANNIAHVIVTVAWRYQTAPAQQFSTPVILGPSAPLLLAAA